MKSKLNLNTETKKELGYNSYKNIDDFRRESNNSRIKNNRRQFWNEALKAAFKEFNINPEQPNFKVSIFIDQYVIKIMLF